MFCTILMPAYHGCSGKKAVKRCDVALTLLKYWFSNRDDTLVYEYSHLAQMKEENQAEVG